MAIALHEHRLQEPSLLQSVRADLEAFSTELADGYLLQSRRETAAALVEIEELSRLVDHLQLLAVSAVVSQDIAVLGESGPEQATSAQDWNVTISSSTSLSASASASAPAPAPAPAPASSSSSSASASARSRQPLSIHRNTAEYLRAKIRISRSEANRRLRLAATIIPASTGPGAAAEPEPKLPVLAEASSAGCLSMRASTMICDAVERVRPVAESHQLEAMEQHLTRQAIESDEDCLRVLARRWESTLDQDGQEPTEKILRARQGVFLRGRRNGLHFLEIGATDEQFEHLSTVMNTATNPRVGTPTTQHGGPGTPHPDGTGPATDTATNSGSPACSTVAGTGAGNAAPVNGDAPGSPKPLEGPQPTRAQNLLIGLVSACRIALASDGLPASGGHRPQVMVTINYRDLINDLEKADTAYAGNAGHDERTGNGGRPGHAGHAVFAHQLSARSIRELACDADIIPIVLGGEGQILDLGRTRRLFPAYLRRALVARDKGCAFPDCTVPATWCEAHHIIPWATGGTTTLSDGVLVCSRHHHVLHENDWTVESIHGIPWFRPPKYLDPNRTRRRNTYWQVEQLVHQQLHHH
ncbi:HNH endonuclease signature motif containing protein [Arthrobacter sp. 35/47]|uniref:HNH endonuclease signature motif containing protein n=2 Tax=Arthrobacter sp. 35/47 TaxID=269454 RepID=UPI0004AE4FF2|nr:HNH endonuclease signature motif containing protein [Arthrobacter sp. 35/47]